MRRTGGTVAHRIEGGQSGPWRVVGEVQQEGALILAPLRLRVRYGDLTPTDVTLIVKSGRTPFRIDCEALPSALEADPDDDLLHAGMRMRRN